ncbi:MAG: glycine zipper 2TM domain-containing protein [Methylophilaceae bacterium]|nr:glycine zipper 2TM domain-containing protein [Methylophilaceae bacterium]
MNTTQKLTLTTITLSVLLATSGCGGMTTRDKSTAVGAGVGAVGGAILTGGGVLGTVGGAAVGGVIGNQVGKDKKK